MEDASPETYLDKMHLDQPDGGATSNAATVPATVFERLAQPRGTFAEHTPALTFADVVVLLEPATYMQLQRANYSLACRHASFVALAVMARVGLKQAVTLSDADWCPEGEDMLRFAGTPARQKFLPVRPTVPLLPLARSIVEDYRRLRPQVREPKLFVTDRGQGCDANVIVQQLRNWGRRRLRTSSFTLIARLHEYFDRCFDGETDRAAVVALRGLRQDALDREVWDSEIVAAAADHRRLARVMERNHPLAGPAGRYRGERARRIGEREPRNLTILAKPLRLSPLLDTDPVLLALRSETWPAPGERGQSKCRKRLRARYFDHVCQLWREGLITPADVRFLFKCRTRSTYLWRDQLEAVTRDVAREERLREIAVRTYRGRGADESFLDVLRRFNAENGCAKGKGWLSLVLMRGGEITRRRGRPRRRGTRRKP